MPERLPARRLTRFNPRPPFPGSDAIGKYYQGAMPDGFNPRPPFPGSDAGAPRLPEADGNVSIHAPRFRGAMRRTASAIWPSSSFQSTPPVSGERCRSGALPGRLSRSFQSTPPVSGERCSSPVTTGSIRTKSPHCANLFIPEQKTSYANSAPSGKPHQIRQKRGARTFREKHVHLRFAQAHRTSGASKSVARKQPCSRTS